MKKDKNPLLFGFIGQIPFGIVGEILFGCVHFKSKNAVVAISNQKQDIFKSLMEAGCFKLNEADALYKNYRDWQIQKPLNIINW